MYTKCRMKTREEYKATRWKQNWQCQRGLTYLMWKWTAWTSQAEITISDPLYQFSNEKIFWAIWEETFIFHPQGGSVHSWWNENRLAVVFRTNMTVLDIEYFLSIYFSSIKLPDNQIVCSHSFYFFRQTRKIKIFLDFGRMIWSEDSLQEGSVYVTLGGL